MASKRVKDLAAGLAFLSPSLLGFLTFTLVPLAFSLVLAFSNWDLRLHNQFKHEPIRFVGIEHFRRLFTDPTLKFWPYLGNTLFFMIGLPLGIVASLTAAILLSKDMGGGSGRNRLLLLAGAILIGSIALLAGVGAGGAGMTILLIGVAATVLVGGIAGGATVYRTLFYIPNFVSGVATMLLWKKIFNPQNGPLNLALAPPLRALGAAVNGTPPGLWTTLAAALCGGAVLLTYAVARRFARLWADGDVGTIALALGAVALAIAPLVAFGGHWLPGPWAAVVAIAAIFGIALAVAAAARTRNYRASPGEATGGTLLVAAGASALAFALLGFAVVALRLPARAAAGLEPPLWLSDVNWAKPSIMLMGFWGAVGSQTMLLYLAALTNVPPDLYEAAEIDGANRRTKFWNVTWPQLAPTTFFVVVMGVIGGLQSGFEAARVMVTPPGGPAGATTTLSYFIYSEGFETGRLGFSSAVAWTLFLIVLVVTVFNLKFGNRYVND